MHWGNDYGTFAVADIDRCIVVLADNSVEMLTVEQNTRRIILLRPYFDAVYRIGDWIFSNYHTQFGIGK